MLSVLFVTKTIWSGFMKRQVDEMTQHFNQ
jgi:hypothetical protein